MKKATIAIVAILVMALIGGTGIAMAHDQGDASSDDDPCGATDHLDEDHDVGEGDAGVERGDDECEDGSASTP